MPLATFKCLPIWLPNTHTSAYSFRVHGLTGSKIEKTKREKKWKKKERKEEEKKKEKEDEEKEDKEE